MLKAIFERLSEYWWSIVDDAWNWLADYDDRQLMKKKRDAKNVYEQGNTHD
jgi:hypothetical protein